MLLPTCWVIRGKMSQNAASRDVCTREHTHNHGNQSFVMQRCTFVRKSWQANDAMFLSLLCGRCSHSLEFGGRCERRSLVLRKLGAFMPMAAIGVEALCEFCTAWTLCACCTGFSASSFFQKRPAQYQSTQAVPTATYLKCGELEACKRSLLTAFIHPAQLTPRCCHG